MILNFIYKYKFFYTSKKIDYLIYLLSKPLIIIEDVFNGHGFSSIIGEYESLDYDFVNISGLKDPNIAIKNIKEPVVIEADINAVLREIGLK